MEERLKEIRPRAPRVQLRERILDAAARQLASRESLWERVWASRLFWTSAAAAVLVGLLLSGVPDAPVRAWAVDMPPSREVEALAESLASMVGDGEAVKHRFVVQLTGPVLSGSSNEMHQLMEDMQWPRAKES